MERARECDRSRVEPRERITNHAAMAEHPTIAELAEGGIAHAIARCGSRGCGHTVDVAIAKLLASGFAGSERLDAVGPRLKCSGCGHRGATLAPREPDCPRERSHKVAIWFVAEAVRAVTACDNAGICMDCKECARNAGCMAVARAAVGAYLDRMRGRGYELRAAPDDAKR